MADTPNPHVPGSTPPGFPFGTVAATLVGLFLFVGLVLLAYNPAYLHGVLGGPAPTTDSKPDPATKLNEVKARNQAVLDGSDPGVKMSAGKAAEELRAAADQTKDETHKHGRLPFPVEPKAPEVKDKK